MTEVLIISVSGGANSDAKPGGVNPSLRWPFSSKYDHSDAIMEQHQCAQGKLQPLKKCEVCGKREYSDVAVCLTSAMFLKI